MRCPKCNLVVSNKKDICPQCTTDLRPAKKQLAIPVSKPSATYDELLATLKQPAAATAAAEPKPDTALPFDTAMPAAPPPAKPSPAVSASERRIASRTIDDSAALEAAKTATLTSRLRSFLSKNAGNSAPPSSAKSTASAQGLTSAALDDELTRGEGPDAHNGLEVVDNVSVVPLDLIDLGDVETDPTTEITSAASAPLDNKTNPEPPQSTPPHLAASPKPAAQDLDDDELDRLFAKINKAAQTSTAQPAVREVSAAAPSGADVDAAPKTPAGDAPTATSPAPHVMDFTGSEELLEQQLDAMIGDTVLEITAVKKPKPPSPKKEEYLNFAKQNADEDLEISFDVEIETDETQATLQNTLAALTAPVAVPSAAAPEESAPQPPGDELPPADPVADIRIENELNPVAGDAALRGRQPATSVVGQDSPIIEEMLVLLAEAYGVTPDVILGTTPVTEPFLAAPFGESPSVVEPSMPAPFSEPSSEVELIVPAPLSEPPPASAFAPPPPPPPLVTETAQEAPTDKSGDGDLDIVLENTFDVAPTPQPAAAAAAQDLWQETDNELSARQTAIDEISVAQTLILKPNDKADLYFELAEEELKHPGRPSMLSYAAAARAPTVDTQALHSQVAAITHNAAVADARKKALEVLAQEHVERRALRPAPRWRRIAGFFVDLTACLGAAAIGLFFCALSRDDQLHVMALQPLAIDRAVHAAAVFPIFGCVSWLLLGGIFIAWRGRTPGQKLFALSVVPQAGGKISAAMSVLRALSQFTTILTCGLGVLPMFGHKRLTLHDRMARTAVVLLR